MIQIAKGSGLCFFQNEVCPSHRPPCALARIGTEKEAEICRTQYPRHLLKALIHSMHICVPITLYLPKIPKYRSMSYAFITTQANYLRSHDH